MEVDRALVPLFIETEVPKRIIQVGTGVFLDFQSEPFLFTAAHVTDNLQHGTLLAPTVNGLSPIDGYLAHIDLPPEVSRNNDRVDMAYYRLDTNFARELCYNFSPLVNKVELIKSSLELGVVSVVGYPVSKSKKKGNIFNSELVHYRGVTADQKIYNKYGFSSENNIIIHFNKKNVVRPKTGEKYNPPSPRGVSGGAIFSWPYGNEWSQDWSIPKLVGIFHSYKEKDGIMIGSSLIPYVSATMLGRMKGYDGVS